MKISFSGVGWKSKIILKRATAYISINKLIVEGCCLDKGDTLHSYLAEDERGRKMIITYLDGKRQTQTNLKFEQLQYKWKKKIHI